MRKRKHDPPQPADLTAYRGTFWDKAVKKSPGPPVHLTVYPSAKNNRMARKLARRKKVMARSVEKEIQRRDELAKSPLNELYLEPGVRYELGLDLAQKGGMSVVSSVDPYGTIQVISQAIFTPPNCYHAGGTEECVPECTMIYGG